MSGFKLKTQTLTIHDSDFGDAEVSLKFDDTGIPWVFAVQVGSFDIDLEENIASQVFAQCALECDSRRHNARSSP